jgi:primosomal replication protein N
LSFLPLLRQACRPAPPGSAVGSLRIPDLSEEANVAVLSGILVEEPVRDLSRDGDPITVLLMSFTAPDEKARQAATCCEVEVLDEIAKGQQKRLRPGGRLIVFGQLTGAGGLWATAIVTR